jgi:hypothetical protein
MKRLTILVSMVLAMMGGTITAQSLPLQMRDGAGQLRLGVATEGESQWLDLCKFKKKGTLYSFTKPVKALKELGLTILPLKDSDGFIVKVERGEATGDVQLCWTFGGCSDRAGSYTTDSLAPEDCRDNVFSVEGGSFITYYGQSMALRVTAGVTPATSDIRLSDGNSQGSPLQLMNSGKKSDAPVICAMAPLTEDTPLYICIYKQNAKADYNYYMMAELFEKSKL